MLRPQLLVLTSWVAVMAAGAGTRATGQVQADPAVGARVDDVLDHVAAGESVGRDAARFVPQLIEIIRDPDSGDCDLAIRALGEFKGEARPAIAALCEKLDDSRHDRRSLAADALVAIGNDAAAPLRELTRSKSGRQRAAALAVLARLDQITLAELQPLSRDDDPRVRVAATSAFARGGRPAVAALIKMLDDPDTVVAVQAARALGMNVSDPDAAVPALVHALERRHVGWAAADALAAYGDKAKLAIPALLRAFPLGESNGGFGWVDIVETALEKIGTPLESDIPAIAELLIPERTQLWDIADKELNLFEYTDDREVALVLEQAIDSELERLRRADTERTSDGKATLRSIESLLSSLWFRTRDSVRFLSRLESSVVASSETITFETRNPWADFTPDDRRRLDSLLKSPNRLVQLSALDGIAKMGRWNDRPTQRLVELAGLEDREIMRAAVQALAATGPDADQTAAPVLLSKLKSHSVSLREFAIDAETLRLNSVEVCSILESGLRDGDSSVALACAAALFRTSQEPRRTAALILNAAKEGHLEDRDAIRFLRAMPDASETIIPYLISQASNSEVAIRAEAVAALGQFGKTAESAVPLLKQSLNETTATVRVAAAKSLFQITGDPWPFDRELRISLAERSSPEIRTYALQAARDLGPTAERYLADLVAALDPADPGFSKGVVEAIKAIGSREAIEQLEFLSERDEGTIAHLARTALLELDSTDGGDGR